MVQPTPALGARLRFSTKQVGRGFYRGNRVGSMGSHTRFGGYLIDWRKARAYNVPDLKDFKLTPYVSREINPKDYDPDAEYDNYGGGDVSESSNQFTQQESTIDQSFVQVRKESHTTSKKEKDLMKYLTAWRRSNPGEFEQFTRYQHELKLAEEVPKEGNVEQAIKP